MRQPAAVVGSTTALASAFAVVRRNSGASHARLSQPYDLCAFFFREHL